MAAGMGSRFGGLKQIAPMGPNDEFIIDYSIYDAIKDNDTYIVACNHTQEDTFDELKALGTGLSGANIVSIFNGTIDFQGFTLTHNIYADNQRMFTNIGSKGLVHNLIYSVKNLNTTRIYDDAAMCFRNFGTIRDIYVKYRGGYVLNNEVYEKIHLIYCIMPYGGCRL